MQTERSVGWRVCGVVTRERQKTRKTNQCTLIIKHIIYFHIFAARLEKQDLI